MAKMDDMEEVSYKESKAQTKARREDGLNMIRPFTFDEKKLLWDGENMKITNLEAANQFVSREYRDGFGV